MDRNPRTFYLSVTSVEANVIAASTEDAVVVEFAGRVPPAVRKRIAAALTAGTVELIEKRLV